MKKGVLLINLGTPKTPTKRDVRTYLKRFLGDQRVIDMPRWQWKPILNLMILPHRPAKSAELYRKIWSEQQGSPLQYYTEQQTKKLQRRIPEYTVKYAMSYSKPFIADVLESFETEHIDALTIIPLYPQYSTTTVGSVVDDINQFYYQRARIPSLHIITDFCSTKEYIRLLSNKVKNIYTSFKPDKVIFSYHGIPVSYIAKGDPYQDRCNLTTKLIMEQLGDIPYIQTYQSRFGPAEWLTPATDATLKELPAKGNKKVLVVSPSFVSDCLETLYELDIENRAFFLENGGTEFKMLPALNDDEAFIDVLEQLVRKP